MTKIFIATPAFKGTVFVPYTFSLIDTTHLLKENDIDYMIEIAITNTLLVAERNRLIALFLETDATHMLCIDADLGWPAQTVKDFIDFDEEFVAGVFPSRQKELLHTNRRIYGFRAIYNDDGSIVKSSKNLLEAECVPAGFLLLKRSAIEKMINKFPELEFKSIHMDLEKEYCLFNTEVRHGEFWGEDYVFCLRAREAGIRIWVDPVVEFNHAGTKGMLINALMQGQIKF